MGQVNCVGGVCTFDPAAALGASEMSAADFKRAVLDSPIPVIVEFQRPENCGRCRKMAPTVEAMTRAQEGDTKTLKIDVDKNPALARQFRVGPLPHFLVFAGGKQIAQERPELVPGETRKRFFTESQVKRIYQQALRQS